MVSLVVNILIFALAIICIVIVLNNNLHSAILNREDRKLWKYLYKNADKFEKVTDEDFDDEIEAVFEFKDDDITYRAYVWKSDLMCAIYVNDELRLSSIDKKYSKLMAEKLL